MREASNYYTSKHSVNLDSLNEDILRNLAILLKNREAYISVLKSALRKYDMTAAETIKIFQKNLFTVEEVA